MAGYTGSAGYTGRAGNIGTPGSIATAGSIAVGGHVGTPAIVGIDGAPSLGTSGAPYPMTAGAGGFAGAAAGLYPFASTPVLEAGSIGRGPCGNTELEYVIDEIDQMDPELADITVLANREQTAASAIFAFASDEGFQLVFRRGDGDCVSGCSDEYWYFDTGGACIPEQVGYYRRIWKGSCYEQTGAPLWDLPSALDPSSVCQSDAG